MTFTQAVVAAMLILSLRRIEDRHPVRPQPIADIIAEIVESVMVILFYAFLWWLLGAGAQH